VNREQAEAFVRHAFAAAAKNPSEATVAEYALTLTEASCEPCAVMVIERIRTEGIAEDGGSTRMFPTAPQVRTAIARLGSSFAHGRHAGRSAIEDRAGDLEAFWRRDVVAIVKTRLDPGDPRELASYVSAVLWWSLPADYGEAQRGYVEADVAEPEFAAIVVETCRRIAEVRREAEGLSLADLAERAWLRVRRRAYEGEENLPAWVVDLEAEPAEVSS
jgi:hypothetical protein